MTKQHKYTSAVQVTENVARVATISIKPNTPGTTAGGLPTVGVVEIIYEIGEETGGIFTRTDTKIATIAIEDLPTNTETAVLDLESKALAYGEAQGIYPPGDEEVI